MRENTPMGMRRCGAGGRPEVGCCVLMTQL
jgi:hypothetical protein